jgi:hypothetical protein
LVSAVAFWEDDSGLRHGLPLVGNYGKCTDLYVDTKAH